MEASTTSKPTMWGLTIAVTSIACSTVVSIGDRDTTEGCSIVIFWMAKTQMFNLRQVFAERRQILEDWLVQFIQRFESLYRRSRMIYQIGLLRSGVMKKKPTQTMHFFPRKSPKFSILCLHQVLNPPEVMGPIEVMTPVVTSAEIVPERCWGRAPWCFGFGQKESRQNWGSKTQLLQHFPKATSY